MRSEVGRRIPFVVLLFLLFFIPALFKPLGQTDIEITNLKQVGYPNYSTSSDAKLTANKAIWNQTFGGAGVDICYSLVEVEAGGFALAGMTNSYNDEWKTWLIRVASNGQHLWDKTYNFSLGYNSRTFVECSDGGFLFAGEIHKDSVNYTALLKTDVSGTHQWNETYGANRWPGRIAVVECSSGGYAFLSTIQLGFSDYLWLVRIDGDGTPLWNQTYNAGESVYASSMLEVSDGDFLLVSLKKSSKDVWIVRTNSTGFTEWDLTYRSFGVPQECWSVLEVMGGLLNGNFVIAGHIFGYSSSGNYNKPCYLWLIEVSGDGNKGGNQSFGFGNDDYGVSLVKVSSGGYSMIGSTSYFGNGKSDMWLVRIEEPGWHRWHRTFGGSENDWG